MSRASEGGHFYHRDGTPCYEVPRADGKGMRPATIRDARNLGLYPGVTSIIKCAAAPGLERWKQDQVLLAALTLPRKQAENDADFCKRVLEDSGEQARKARERGTQIHAAIQGHYEGKAPDEEFWPFVRGVQASLCANFGGQEWVAERPVAHSLGFGTKADLSSHFVVVDFKGSDFTEEEAPTLKTWDEHHMQLAATRKAIRDGAGITLGIRAQECAIVYVSRTVPGLVRVIRVDEPELEQGWKMFCGLHAYWCAKNRYWPQEWKEAA